MTARSPPPAEADARSYELWTAILEHAPLGEDEYSSLACVAQWLRRLSRRRREMLWLEETEGCWIAPQVLRSWCLGIDAQYALPPGADLHTRGPLIVDVRTPGLDPWRPDDPRRRPVTTYRTAWRIAVGAGMTVWDKLQLNRAASLRLRAVSDHGLPGGSCMRCGSIPDMVAAAPTCADHDTGLCCEVPSCFRPDDDAPDDGQCPRARGFVCWHLCSRCDAHSVMASYWDGELWHAQELREERTDSHRASLVECSGCSAPNLVYWAWSGITNAEHARRYG